MFDFFVCTILSLKNFLAEHDGFKIEFTFGLLDFLISFELSSDFFLDF